MSKKNKRYFVVSPWDADKVGARRVVSGPHLSKQIAEMDQKERTAKSGLSYTIIEQTCFEDFPNTVLTREEMKSRNEDNDREEIDSDYDYFSKHYKF